MLLLAGEFIYSNSTVEGKPFSPPTEIGLLVCLERLSDATSPRTSCERTLNQHHSQQAVKFEFHEAIIPTGKFPMAFQQVTHRQG